MKHTLVLILCLGALTSCKLDKSYPSREVVEYKQFNANTASANKGQINFALDAMGTFSLSSLFKVNILPIKIYGTALLLMEPNSDLNKLDSKDLPIVMQKFGFLHPNKIANWKTEISPEPKNNGSLGFVHTQINQVVFGQKISIEVANLTCAACHSSVTYDFNGNPKNEAWLGGGNSSLNIDGFLNQIYFGLKKGMENPEKFISKIREAYPMMTAVEEHTIRKYIFPKIVKSLKDYKLMDRVLPFPNGGPGHTNGLGAFKRDANILKNPFIFHSDEAGIVGIPNITGRGFRSSLTIDGAYGVKGKARYETFNKDQALDPIHLDELAELTTFFTFSAMGNSIKNIEPNIYKSKEIYAHFLNEALPNKFPGIINSEKAIRGETVYRQSCASCHGTYSEGIDHVQMLSFPNKHVSQKLMGTDPYRWQKLDKTITDFTFTNVFNKYIDAGHSLDGYVSPILSGIWSKGPFLHNGSVPTLWQLMNPEIRPTRFQVGGHAIDLEAVGIKGELNSQGDYLYPATYIPWSIPAIFNTEENGKSNKGHEKEFENLSVTQKWDLIEYLKLL